MSTALSVDSLALSQSRSLALRLLAGSTVFLSAFLLFQVQPMLAKTILPWFGGTAAVWTTCMLFFQCTLFLGYGYAHLLTRVRPAAQALIHSTLLLSSLALLPVIPGTSWKPLGSEEPIGHILGLLAVSVGLPYFLLSSTSPLVQAWLSRMGPDILPYRFYALSNLASLVALLAYPAVVEPLFNTTQQANGWSWLHLLFAAGCGALAWRTARSEPPAPTVRAVEEPRTGTNSIIGWTILAACPSILSLAVTNHLTQNVASIPFLWVLPLGVYLLSLILCFDRDRWNGSRLVTASFAIAIVAMGYVLVDRFEETNLKFQVPFWLVVLFAGCMYLHGQLAERKPVPTELTRYYLALSLGGALGSVAVGLAAPVLLSAYFELPFALALCTFAALMLEYRKRWYTDILWVSLSVSSLVVASMFVTILKSDSRVMMRNFYGGLRIVDSRPPPGQEPERHMIHGTVTHGAQLLKPSLRRQPLSYYAYGTGVELALTAWRKPGMRVGVIGLGAGVLAAYGRPGEAYRFYEINPLVEQLARTEFTYMTECRAKTLVVIGDGRLSLEREEPNQFDVLVVDAFSGDSIPVHLLTRESFDAYFRHIRPGGVLAIHVSNQALDLAPVVVKIAQAIGKDSIRHVAKDDPKLYRATAHWMLVGDSAEFDRRPSLRAAASNLPSRPDLPLWTDNYSNLIRVLK